MADPDAPRRAALGELADNVYRAVLGRPIDDESRVVVVDELLAGRLTRPGLVDALVSSAEYQESAAIAFETARALAAREPFRALDGAAWASFSERVVEIPWVLSRYRGERRVLDIGSANAPTVYREVLGLLAIPDLFNLDFAASRVSDARAIEADVRRLPLPDRSIDLALCISTLEHIGRDNDRYGIRPDLDASGDLTALREIARVLRPDGRLLVTVPFGSREDHGWFVQYDESSWETLVTESGFRVDEQDCYLVSPQSGWRRLDDRRTARRASYGVDAVAAQAVLCAALVASRP